MKKTNLITAGLLILMMGVAGWTAWWFFLATYGQRAAASATQEDATTRLEYASVERFGFPFTVGFRFREARVTTPWLDGQAHVSTTFAEVSARPWRPRHIMINLPQGLGYATTGEAGRITGEAASAKGLATSNPEPHVELRLTNLIARPATSAPITAKHGLLTWRKPVSGPQGLDLAFADLEMAENALFGPTAKQADITLRLHGEVPLDGDPAHIAAWRAADGKVDVTSARVRWGALDLLADGAVGLDERFRLAGGLNLKIANGDGAMDRLQALGLLSSEASTVAKAFLALASLSGGGRATAPLIFANGEASLSGFPIAQLAPVCACR
jgi:hypothetical protein